ncbi:MAG: hypothetical protein JW751_02955 [Polyangiaceae bacterium]|nr:hypothetical protein [Polyangiaceae bacterium]
MLSLAVSSPLLGHRGFLGAAVCALGLGSAPARATAPEPYRLVYEAPNLCPDAVAFMDAVRSRTERAWFVTTPGMVAKTVTVSIQASERGFVGRLEMTLGTEPSSRRFEESSCAELVSALALVTVLAIDPTAVLEDRQEPVGRAESPAPAPPTPREPGSPGQWTMKAAAGVSFLSIWGPASEPLLAVAPQAEIGLSTEPGWRLGLRFQPVFAETGTFGPSAEEASFRWQALRLGICPAFVLAEGFELGPCVLSDLGALRVEGEGVPQKLHETRPWFALGAGGAITFTRVAMVSLSGGALFPMVRDRFVMLPDRELVYEPEAVGSSVELTVGMRFP